MQDWLTFIPRLVPFNQDRQAILVLVLNEPIKCMVKIFIGG